MQIKPAIFICFGEFGTTFREAYQKALENNSKASKWMRRLYYFLHVHTDEHSGELLVNEKNFRVESIQNLGKDYDNVFDLQIYRPFSRIFKRITAELAESIAHVGPIKDQKIISPTRRIYFVGSCTEPVFSMLLRRLANELANEIKVLGIGNMPLEAILFLGGIRATGKNEDKDIVEAYGRAYGLLWELETEFQPSINGYSPFENCWLFNLPGEQDYRPPPSSSLPEVVAEGFAQILLYGSEEALDRRPELRKKKAEKYFQYSSFGFRKISWSPKGFSDLLAPSILEDAFEEQNIILGEKTAPTQVLSMAESVLRSLEIQNRRKRSEVLQELCKYIGNYQLPNPKTFESFQPFYAECTRVLRVSEGKLDQLNDHLLKKEQETWKQQLLQFIQKELESITINQTFGISGGIGFLTKLLKAEDNTQMSLSNLIVTGKKELKVDEITLDLNSWQVILETSCQDFFEQPKPKKRKNILRQLLDFVQRLFKRKQESTAEVNPESAFVDKLVEFSEACQEYLNSRIRNRFSLIQAEIWLSLIDYSSKLKKSFSDIRNHLINNDSLAKQEGISGMLLSRNEVLDFLERTQETLGSEKIRLKDIIEEPDFNLDDFLTRQTRSLENSFKNLSFQAFAKLIGEQDGQELIKYRFQRVISQIRFLIKCSRYGKERTLVMSSQEDADLIQNWFSTNTVQSPALEVVHDLSQKLFIYKITHGIDLDDLASRIQLEINYAELSKTDTVIHPPDFRPDNPNFPKLFTSSLFPYREARKTWIKGRFSGVLTKEADGKYSYLLNGDRLPIGKERMSVIRALRNPNYHKTHLEKQFNNWLSSRKSQLDEIFQSFLEVPPQDWVEADTTILQEILTEIKKNGSS